ncbi:MAG: hypothetical protein RXQ62_02150 [Nitrososphaeria archaeon]|jgi:hypothetical protein
MSDEVESSFGGVVEEIRRMREAQAESVAKRLEEIRERYSRALRELQASSGA